MKHYVYETVNLINGKKYIGKRSCKCNIKDDKYIGSGKLLIKAIKKYGKNNFHKKILAICTTENEAYKLEHDYIENKKAYSDPRYYNLSHGGKGSSSDYAKKLWKNAEYREKTIKNSNKRWSNYEFMKNYKLNKKVIRVNDCKIFNSASEASRITQTSKSSIIEVCNNKYFYSGTIQGLPSVWMYLDEYSKLTSNELISINKKIKTHNAKRGDAKIILLNNNKIFNSFKEASEYIGLKDTKGIYRCCNGERKSAGKINGEKATWSYYK